MDDFYPMDLNPTGNPYDYYRIAVLPGSAHLDGVRALQYLRSRHGDQRGDFARSERQQQLLLAIKAQAKHWNIAVGSSGSPAARAITTDLGLDSSSAPVWVAS